MDARRTAQVRQWVGKPYLGLGMIGQHVLTREAFPEALGPEQSIDDIVSYSQFAWFIWELIDAEESERAGVTSAPATPSERRATDAPKLLLLPARMQRKGLFYVTDNLQLLLAVVGAADPGIIQLRWMDLSDLSRKVLSGLAEVVREVDGTTTRRSRADRCRSRLVAISRTSGRGQSGPCAFPPTHSASETCSSRRMIPTSSF